MTTEELTPDRDHPTTSEDDASIDDASIQDEVRLAQQNGRQQFMGIDLEVMPGVLVPRQETELLGQTAVRLLQQRGANQRAIDMCCGSGNLACGIMAAIADVQFWLSDLTDETVQLARRNVDHFGFTERATVVQGDLFAGLEGKGLEGGIDMIVCNPPYISTARLAKDRAHLLEQEPREAFDGGSYGISIHQRVIKDAITYLKPDGWLLFEMGVGQAKQVSLLFRRVAVYGEVQFVEDAMNEPRVAFAQRIS